VYSRTIVPSPVNRGGSHFCKRTVSVPGTYRLGRIGAGEGFLIFDCVVTPFCIAKIFSGLFWFVLACLGARGVDGGSDLAMPQLASLTLARVVPNAALGSSGCELVPAGFKRCD